MRLRLTSAIVGLLFAVSLAGCGYYKYGESEDPTLNQVMQIGKEYLRSGDGGNAADAFNAALHISPTCPEAKYGLLIARNMQFIALVNSLLGFVGGMSSSSASTTSLEQLSLPPPAGSTDSTFDASTEPIGDYIQGFLQQSADVWYDTCEGLYGELIHDPNAFFELDQFSMSITGIVTINFGGRLDRSDLQFFGVLNSFVRSVVDIVLAHNINADFFSLKIPAININTGLLSDLTPANIAELLQEVQPIITLLDSLINNPDNPDFLTLESTGGVARMQAAGVNFGNLFDRIDLLIGDAYGDPLVKAVNTVHFIDAEGNNRGNRLVDSLYLPGLGEFGAAEVNGLDALAVPTADAFWDTTPSDVDPTRPNPFYIAFANQLLTALNVLPIVIDRATLASLLTSIGINPDILPAGFQIVISEIPYILPIDVGPFFADPSPTGIRDLLVDLINLFNELVVLFPPPAAS
jgi:hypothetical protein